MTVLPGRADVGTVSDLRVSATRLVGLEDFGDDEYVEGLEVLLESYAADAGLTPFGNKVHRASVRSALVARLLAEAGWKQHPAYAEVPVRQPIFVTGLPRTGTTALHRLLAEDPAHQGLELWLTEVPQPRPPRETWAENPVFRGIQAGYERHHVEHPEFMGLHHSSAEQVEECWRLLRQSLRSVSFECLAHLPRYSRWLSTQDWTGAYARHRRLLQLIGLPDADRRWVLKNPSHLFAIDAVLTAYPDALVIQTHRAPSTIVASVCSLNEQASDGWSDVFRGEVVGADQLDLWARGADEFLAARTRHNPAQFCDVHYEDFVADPIGTVSAVYHHFGLTLTPEARTAMTAVHEESRTGARKPSHRYKLADFGLSAQEVDERFAGYLAAHGRA